PLRLVEAAHHGRGRTIFARRVAVEIEADFADVPAIADIECDVAGSDLITLKLTGNRFLEHRGPAGNRFGDNQVIELIIGKGVGVRSPDVELHMRTLADRQLGYRIAPSVVRPCQDVESAWDLAAVQFQRCWFVISFDMPGRSGVFELIGGDEAREHTIESEP